MTFLTEQMTDKECVVLADLVRRYALKNMRVVELGSYTGKSALAMAPVVKEHDGILTCVDWFKGNVNVLAELTQSYEENDILSIFRTNLETAGVEDCVNIVVGTTTSAASMVADESVDLVFIDADHRYTNVKDDIRTWYKKVKVGGVICGHDFDKHISRCQMQRVMEYCEEDFVDGCHYGVVRAVCELFPNVQHKERIWYAQKCINRLPVAGSNGIGQDEITGDVPPRYGIPRVEKNTKRLMKPLVSIILLDWSVRERFQALQWLSKQDVARDSYELIWVELFDGIAPEVAELADVVVTCQQRETYHKHLGYNIGLLKARGEIVTVCDSDAVFPPNFIKSILESFGLGRSEEGESLVLMHHEWRTRNTYPNDLNSVDELTKYEWKDLWPNVGACMSVRRCDAIRFGGFDEHKSFQGYLCGPYDLGWRMVNAGIPEVWHDEKVALWHFAHPEPQGTNGLGFSWKRWQEVRYPHVNYHALKAVEAFSTGRILPLQENSEIHALRMDARQIGTPFEVKYATMTGTAGFSRSYLLKKHIALLAHPITSLLKKWVRIKTLRRIRGKVGLRTRLRSLFGVRTSPLD